MAKLKIRFDLIKLNRAVYQWLIVNNKTLLNELLPSGREVLKYESTEALERLSIILEKCRNRGFRNGKKDPKREKEYVIESKKHSDPRVVNLVTEINTYPTEGIFILECAANDLIQKVKASGVRPLTCGPSGKGSEVDTWKWIKLNKPDIYNNLLESTISAQEKRILEKLNKLLIFCKKNKRKPNESKSEIRLSTSFYNLICPRRTRENNRYRSLILEIESYCEPQRRAITKEFVIKEAKKYKSLSDMNDKDRTLYKQMVTKPWFREIRTLLYPNAQRRNSKIKRSDGTIYDSSKLAAEKNNVSMGQLYKGLHAKRKIGGYRWAYCDDEGNVIETPKQGKKK